MSDAAARTLPATPRRREEARRAGMMPTAALPAWAATAAVALALAPAWGRATLPAAAEMIRRAIRAGVAPDAPVPDLAAVLPAAVLLPTVGLVLAAGAAGLAVRFLLDGFTWQPGRAAWDMRRIDPVAGLRRIFSAGTLAATLGAGLGLAALAAAAWLARGPLVGLVADGDPHAGPRAVLAARHTILAVAAAAAVVAACQWGLARLRFERRIRMTPQEFTDEAKSMQADPKIRLLHQQRRRAG
jgi:flagellar biosynthetic protein FlhB